MEGIRKCHKTWVFGMRRCHETWTFGTRRWYESWDVGMRRNHEIFSNVTILARVHAPSWWCHSTLFLATTYSDNDSCTILKHLYENTEVILSNFYNMLSFEHYIYFINIMLTIYQLSQNGFLLMILVIEDNNRAVVRGRTYSTRVIVSIFIPCHLEMTMLEWASLIH